VNTGGIEDGSTNGCAWESDCINTIIQQIRYSETVRTGICHCKKYITTNLLKKAVRDKRVRGKSNSVLNS